MHMCVYIYIHMNIYVYVHRYTYIYTHLNIYIYTYHMYMMHCISCIGGLFKALKGGLLAHAYTHKSMHIDTTRPYESC